MRRCPACMEQLGKADHCVKCGLPVSAMKSRSDGTLPPEYLLGGRYELGLPAAKSRQAICYAAWDREEDQKVLVEEFYPSAASTREGNTVRPSGKGHELFPEAMRAFYESPAPGKRPLSCIDRQMDNGTCYRIYAVVQEAELSAQAESLLDRPVLFRDGTGKALMSINALPIPPLPRKRVLREAGPEHVKGQKTAKDAKGKKKSLFFFLMAGILLVLIGCILLIARPDPPRLPVESPPPIPVQETEEPEDPVLVQLEETPEAEKAEETGALEWAEQQDTSEQSAEAKDERESDLQSNMIPATDKKQANEMDDPQTESEHETAELPETPQEADREPIGTLESEDGETQETSDQQTAQDSESLGWVSGLRRAVFLYETPGGKRISTIGRYKLEALDAVEDSAGNEWYRVEDREADVAGYVRVRDVSLQTEKVREKDENLEKQTEAEGSGNKHEMRAPAQGEEGKGHE